MSFALYLDEHVDIELAILLRALGHDVLPTQEAGLSGAPDHDQIAFATENGRAVVTHDVADYQRLAGEWAVASRVHAGIILCRRASTVALRDRFVLMFEEHPDGVANLCTWLTRS